MVRLLGASIAEVGWPRGPFSVKEGKWAMTDTPEDDDRTFGQLVSDRRTELGWSQGDLAKRLDVFQQTVSRWESGLAHPRPRTVREIAMTLGLPSGPLLLKTGYLTEEEMPSALEQPEPVDPLLSKFLALSQRDRKTIEQMVDVMLSQEN